LGIGGLAQSPIPNPHRFIDLLENIYRLTF
jgi:hypothetical protein